MIPWSILCEHGLALLLVWAWAALAGFAIFPMLRLHVGRAGIPLVGVVYWSVALYAFPFAGGLDIAAGLVVILACVQCARRRLAWNPFWKRFSWSTLLFAIGSVPYLTTLLVRYVPLGMDGSMHTTTAALIARAGGLPESYAPYAADVPFPPMNIGQASLAGAAICWGGETAAVMLATHHLTFTLLILATYLLLRRWTPRAPATLIAMLSVWTARASQASLEWAPRTEIETVSQGRG